MADEIAQQPEEQQVPTQTQAAPDSTEAADEQWLVNRSQPRTPATPSAPASVAQDPKNFDFSKPTGSALPPAQDPKNFDFSKPTGVPVPLKNPSPNESLTQVTGLRAGPNTHVWDALKNADFGEANERILNWLNAAKDDVNNGTDETVMGSLMKSLGAPGLEVGPEGAKPLTRFFGGVIQGPLRFAQAGEHFEQGVRTGHTGRGVVKGLNDLMSGFFQTAGPLAIVTGLPPVEGAAPVVAPMTKTIGTALVAQYAGDKIAGALGADDDVRELVGNLFGMFGGSTMHEVLKPAAVERFGTSFDRYVVSQQAYDNSARELEIQRGQARDAQMAANDAYQREQAGKGTKAETDQKRQNASAATASAMDAQKKFDMASRARADAKIALEKQAKAMEKQTAGARSGTAAQWSKSWQDFSKAIPNTGANQYGVDDWDTWRSYAEPHHEKVQPITSVKDVAESAEYEREKLENDAMSYTHGDAYRNQPLQTHEGGNEAMDYVRQALAGHDRVQPGFSDRAIDALQNRFNTTDLTLEEADELRKEINRINRATLKQNSWSLSDAEASDPAFAAREALNDYIKQTIEQRLQDLDVQGVRENRLDQASLVRIRNAAEAALRRNANIGDVRVRGTGEAGMGRQGLAWTVRRGAEAGGAAVAGPWGAAAAGGMTEPLINRIVKPDLTRDQLIERSMQDRRGNPIKVATGMPVEIAAGGEPGAPPAAPLPPRVVEPVVEPHPMENSPLHAELQAYFHVNPGDEGASYPELVDAIREEEGIYKKYLGADSDAIPKDLTKLVEKVNAQEMAERLEAARAARTKPVVPGPVAETTGPEGEVLAAQGKGHLIDLVEHGDNSRASVDMRGRIPDEGIPASHLGDTPEESAANAAYHEGDHHAGAAAMGIPTRHIEIGGPGREGVMTHVSDLSKIDWSNLADVWRVAVMKLSAAAGDFEWRDIAPNTNFGLGGGAQNDYAQARSFFERLTKNEDDVNMLMDMAWNRAVEIASHPDVHNIIDANYGLSEANLMDELAMTTSRAQKITRAIQNVLGEYDEAKEGAARQRLYNDWQAEHGNLGGPRGGETGGPTGERPAVRTEPAQVQQAPEGPLPAGPAGTEGRSQLTIPKPTERSTGSPDRDDIIRQGGGVPGGIWKGDPTSGAPELTMFHDPQTGTTLAIKTQDGITPEKVAEKIAASRKTYEAAAKRRDNERSLLAQGEDIESSDRINEAPPFRIKIDAATTAGGNVSKPFSTYHEASTETEGNPWIRRSADPARSASATNEDRMLMVQFSSDMINGAGLKDEASDYYDKLYSGKREGYDRLQDFWEIPQWMGFVSHIAPDADVYVVRNMAEAQQFLKEAGYGRVAFSALDVNTNLIKTLVKGYNGHVDIGGYVEPGTFLEFPNAKYHPTVESLAKDMGVPYDNGVDYRHFEGSDVIPRLTMSQGCLHKCAFCSVPKNLDVTPNAVVDQQVDAIGKLGSKLVYLNDKTFGQAPNYQYLADMNVRLKAANPNFKGFIVQTTAAQMNKIPADWLAKSGIKYVELGIESYNDPILKDMHKPATERLINNATQKLRENGVTLIPNIMIGLPGETPETYAHTLQWLQENRDIISHANIYNTALYKGTELAGKFATLTDSDFNENVMEKSFHDNPEIHRTFAGDLYGQMSKQLDMPIDRGHVRTLDPAERSALARTRDGGPKDIDDLKIEDVSPWGPTKPVSEKGAFVPEKGTLEAPVGQYHPALQAMAEKVPPTYDPTDIDKGASWIAPDGRFLMIGATQHPDSIEYFSPGYRQQASRAEGGDIRIPFINDTKAIRVRWELTRGGPRLVMSIPKEGVTPEQEESIKQAVGIAAKKHASLDMEIAARNGHFISTDFVRPSQVPFILDELTNNPEAQNDKERSTLGSRQTAEGTDYWRDPDATTSFEYMSGSGQSGSTGVHWDMGYAGKGWLGQNGKFEPVEGAHYEAHEDYKEQLRNGTMRIGGIGIHAPVMIESYTPPSEEQRVWLGPQIQRQGVVYDLYNPLTGKKAAGELPTAGDFWRFTDKFFGERPTEEERSELAKRQKAEEPEINKVYRMEDNSSGIVGPDGRIYTSKHSLDHDRLTIGAYGDKYRGSYHMLDDGGVRFGVYGGDGFVEITKNDPKTIQTAINILGALPTKEVQFTYYGPRAGASAFETEYDDAAKVIGQVRQWQNASDAERSELAKPVRWQEKAADKAKAEEGFSFNLRGKEPKYGFMVEMFPEQRKTLNHTPTAQDIADYVNENKDLLRAHPELFVGGYGKELNIAGRFDDQKAALRAAKKLDQSTIWDIENKKLIPAGGEGKQTKFPRYSVNQRMNDLSGPERDTTEVVEKGSTVGLRKNPLPVTGTSPLGNVLTTDIAKALADRTKTNLGALQLGVATPEEQIARATPIAEDEAKYQLAQNNTGKAWYTTDMKVHDDILREMRPELNDPVKMSLFKMSEAILSSGHKPYQNLKKAVQSWDHYNETGEFSEHNVNFDPSRRPSDDNPYSWGPRGAEAYGNAMGMLNRLIQQYGEKGAVDWLMSDHTTEQLKDYNKNVQGEADELQPGTRILGPKRGPFAQNLHGLEAAFTADVWVSRTWNRWMGTTEFAPDGELLSDSPRNETERRLMKQSFSEAAQKMGLTTSQFQAILWYYEQALYDVHGSPKESWSFADAAKRVRDEMNAESGAKKHDQQNLPF